MYIVYWNYICCAIVRALTHTSKHRHRNLTAVVRGEWCVTSSFRLVRGEWSPHTRVTLSHSVRIPINNIYPPQKGSSLPLLLATMAEKKRGKQEHTAKAISGWATPATTCACRGCCFAGTSL